MGANFRDWPSKVVVEGTGEDTNTYIGYSPIAGASLSASVWVVERIDTAGSNTFASGCMAAGNPDPEPVVAMDGPASLDYVARS